MGRRIESLTLRTLDDLPARCRSCVFWELNPLDRAVAMEHDPDFEKEAWVSATSLDIGTCGKVAYMDGIPAGYALAGMPGDFPRAAFFPARVSKDAYFLATLFVYPEHTGLGVGKALVQAIVKDAKDRGKRAIECFADREWRAPDCMIPAGFCEATGWRVKRDHARFPLMRIDMRSLAKVASQMEAAMEELLRTVRAPAEAPSPARTTGV